MASTHLPRDVGLRFPGSISHTAHGRASTPTGHITPVCLMGLLQLRYEHDSSTIRLRFERDTTSYEELCAFEQ